MREKQKKKTKTRNVMCSLFILHVHVFKDKNEEVVTQRKLKVSVHNFHQFSVALLQKWKYFVFIPQLTYELNINSFES